MGTGCQVLGAERKLIIDRGLVQVEPNMQCLTRTFRSPVWTLFGRSCSGGLYYEYKLFCNLYL